MRLLISRWGAWAALAAGAVLCALGWYGVSGERFAARQIPYLASCTVPGAALIVAGAVLLAAYGPEGGPRGERGERERGEHEGPGEREWPGASGGPPGEPGAEDTGPVALVAVPAGTLAHTPGCPLVDGKPEATPLEPEALRERELRPCPICEPALPAVPSAAGPRQPPEA